MQSESFARSQTIDRINQQIQMIRNHPHVKNLEKINQYAYTIMYHPYTLKTPYKQKIYTLELILPTNYPIDPPSLRFLDQIYHLNIGYHSGEVRMSILEDDWSTFLSLYSLIESLDSIIQEPDPLYSLDQKVLDLYQSDQAKYLSKVAQQITLCDVVLCYSAEKNPSPPNIDYSDISSLKNKYSIRKPYSPNKKSKASLLVQQFRNSMENSQGQQIGEQMLISQYETGNFPTLVKTESKQQKKFTDPNKQQYKPQHRDKQSIDMDQAKSVEAVEIRLGKTKNNIVPQIPKTKNNKKNNGQQDKNQTLIRINETLKIFIQQLNEIQSQISLTNNKQIKALLSEKYDAQLVLLKQVMQLSQNTKRKIVNRLRQQVSRL